MTSSANGCTKIALGFAFFIVCVAAVVFLASPKFRNPPRVLWFTFNRDAISVMNSAGFSVVGVTSMSPEEIPDPFGARIRALLRFPDRMRLPANEFEPTTLRIIAQRQGRGEVRCLARYHEGYVAVILLRYPRGLQEEAAILKKALHAAYPREKIELEENPPAYASTPATPAIALWLHGGQRQ